MAPKFCTKNGRVKGWWNWQQVSFTLFNLHISEKIRQDFLFWLDALSVIGWRPRVEESRSFPSWKRLMLSMMKWNKSSHSKNQSDRWFYFYIRRVVKFINILRAYFCMNLRFGSFYYVHVTRKSCWNDIRTKKACVLHWWNWLLLLMNSSSW